MDSLAVSAKNLAPHSGERKPNAFLSILREAGKPASLRITRFDLPEAYGIIDGDYRMKKMAHVVARFRLASASKAAQKAARQPQSSSDDLAAAADSDDITHRPKMLIQTTATSLMTSTLLMDDGVSETSNNSNTLAISPDVTHAPAPGDLSLPAKEGTQASCGALLDRHRPLCRFPFDEEGHGFRIEATMIREACQEHFIEAAPPIYHGSTAAAVALDPPANPKADFEKKRAAAPLTVENVALLRPGPTDPQTGASLLKDVQSEVTRRWVQSLRQRSGSSIELTLLLLPSPSAMVSTPTTMHGSDGAVTSRARSPLALPQKSEKAAAALPPPSARRNQQQQHHHGPNNTTIIEPQIQLQSPLSPRRLSMPNGESDDSDTLAGHAPTAAFARHIGELLASVKLQDPLGHINTRDPAAALLQSFHFHYRSPEHAVRSSWLTLATHAEKYVYELLQKELSDGTSITSIAAIFRGGSKASVLKESAADPSLLQQRMLSVMLRDDELHVLRGHVNLCRGARSAVSAMSALAASSLAEAPSPTGTGTRAALLRRIASSVATSSVASQSPPTSPSNALKSETSFDVQNQLGGHLGGLPMRSNNKFRRTAGNSAEEASSILQSSTITISGGGRLQLKMGSGVTSRLRVASVTPAVEGTGSWFPPTVANMPCVLKSPSETRWNAAFQGLLDELCCVSSIPQAIEAHQRLTALHQAFVDACGIFVEVNLLGRIVDEVQVAHDGILFTLVTLPSSPGGHSGAPTRQNAPSPASSVKRNQLSSDISTSNFEQDLTADEFPVFVVTDEAPNDASDTALVPDDEESARKTSSASLRALNCFAQNWFRVGVHESSLSPFANDEVLDLLMPAPNNGISFSSPDFVARYLAREARRSRVLSAPNHSATHPLVLEQLSVQRDTVFPLSCAVHYCGFVVHCTARMPPSCEQTAAAVSRKPRPSNLLTAIGKDIGVYPYLDLTHAADAAAIMTTEFAVNQDGTNTTEAAMGQREKNAAVKDWGRVDLSRHVVVGDYPATTTELPPRAVVLAAPTIFPPMVPTMHYSPWLRLRPEFTRRLMEELTSDVFSASCSSSVFPQKAAAQALAVKAARKLLHKSITDLVKCWEISKEPLKGDELCEVMHQRGINMSLLGYIGDLLDTKMQSISAMTSGAGHKTPVSIPGSAGNNSPPAGANSGGGGDERNRALEALSKALTTVKEEMVVRTFRWHWNSALRERCLGTSPASSSYTSPVTLRSPMHRPTTHVAEMKQLSTDLVRQLLGNESDPLVSTFWANIINERVKTHFRFRAPLGRKDISLRTTLQRLERLCGIVVSPGTEKDALNPAVFRQHEELLNIDLRSTRSIAIGSVVEIRPYVKTAMLPSLPPLWRLQVAQQNAGGGVGGDLSSNAQDIARQQQQLRANVEALVAYLEKRVSEASVDCGLYATATIQLELRLAETLFMIGEHRYEACEHLLTQLLRRLQRRPAAPMYHEAVSVCLSLSRLFFSAHRHLDATRCADDALCVAGALQNSVYQSDNAFLFAVLFSASKEGGNRELTIHALERSIVASARRIETLMRDPYSTHLTWKIDFNATTTIAAAVMDAPTNKDAPQNRRQNSALPPSSNTTMDPLRRQLLFEQQLLFHSIHALVDAYKAISYHTLHDAMPFHESVATPFFLKFLFEVACGTCGSHIASTYSCDDVADMFQMFHGNGADIVAAQAVLARALHLSEILQLKTADPLVETQLVEMCKANLSAVTSIASGSYS